MAFGDGQTLHGGELVTACGVCDLQRADALVAADHLPVGVLDSGDVALTKGSLHEAQDQGAFAHSTGSKHNHPVIIALLWHSVAQKDLDRAH